MTPDGAQAREHYGLPPVLTVDEAAEFLRVHKNTLYISIAAGEVPHKRVGKRVVILRDALLEWLRSTERALPSRRRH